MNRIFRTLWNDVSRTYVAVAETVRGRGKRASSCVDGAVVMARPAGQQRALTRRRPMMLALEQRFMFDGAAVDTAHAAADAAVAAATVEATAHADSTAVATTDASHAVAVETSAVAAESSAAAAESSAVAAESSAAKAADTSVVATAASATTVTEVTSTATVHSVIVVDWTVADYKTLIAGIDPSTPVIVLQPGQSGLSGLAAALSGYHDLDSIYLVTEGASGAIQLGLNVVDDAAIAADPTDIAAIGAALKPGGDLLLYGCSVAKGEAGEKFVSDLAKMLVDVDVAASTDKTGPTALGGDWDLEYSTGTIETVLPFTLAGMQDISHCLGCEVGAAGSDPHNYLSSNGTDGVQLMNSGHVVGWYSAYGYNSGMFPNAMIIMPAYAAGGGSRPQSYTTDLGYRAYSLSVVNAQSLHACTMAFNDSDATVSTGGTAEATSIDSTVVSEASAVQLLDFTIADPSNTSTSNTDTVPTIVSQIVVATTGSTADLSKMTFVLSGADISGSVTGTYNSGTNTITFSGLTISVADGGNETYAIKAYFSDSTSSSDVVDHSTIKLSVNASQFTTGSSGTAMASGQTSVTNGAGASVSVAATKLVYATSPSASTSGSALSGQPVVYAVDARGNIDKDYEGTITLSEASAGALSGTTSMAASAGVATFSGIIYTATADHQGFTLSAASGLLTPAATSSIDSNVVATKLVFTTEPAVTTLQSGVATSLSTVVVKAEDASGLVDTDYAGAVALSLTTPADTAVSGSVDALTVSGGDTDSSASTVTVAASSGVATFANLSLDFTTAASEMIVLHAASGILTLADSTTLTVNSAPAVSSIARSGSSALAASATSATYTVTFSQAVSGVDASDFTLTATGNASASIASVTGSGSTYTVTVSGLAGDGSLRLDLNGSGTGIANGSSIALGAGYASGQSYTLDHTAPTAPAAPELDSASDSGVSASDKITSDTTPTISGTAESGSTVSVYDGATLLGTAVATGGSWSYTAATLSAGNHSFTATATDAAGNVSPRSTSTAITIDASAPTVSSVSVPASGSYAAGSTLTFIVHADQNVYIDTTGGTPRLVINVGGNTSYATYALGSGSTDLVFAYTVQAGEIDSDGIVINGLQTNGGSITDAAGNALVTTLAGVGSTSGVRVDTSAPAVSSVGVSANATYYTGEAIELTVNYNEAVTVNTSGGTPRIAIVVGATMRYATYVSGSGGSALTFAYTVISGDVDANGISVGALALNGGSIRDAAGNNAVLTLNNVGSTAAVDVDGSQPSVTSVNASTADGFYGAGSTISITVDFSSAVTVDSSGGTPTLALDTGGSATYTGGSGSATLTFSYTVGSGQNSGDLDYSSPGALSLNGGTIVAAGGGLQAALLTLATPSTAGSLGANRAIVIDTAAPGNTVTSIVFSADSGSSNTDLITKTPAQTLSGALATHLVSGEFVYVSLDNGANWALAAASGTNWSLAGLTLTGSGTVMARVVDQAGNIGTTNAAAYVLDTTAPAISFSGIALSADTGASSSDFITRTAAQTISATLSGAPAGSDVVYGSLDGGATWTDITSKVSGTTLTWNGVTLAGSNTLTLRVTDAAGNDGAVTSQAYVLDTTTPSTSIATVRLSNDSGVSSTDFITNVAAQTVSGTLSANLAAGETVYVSLDNGATWAAASATVGANPWSLAGVTLTASSTLKVKVSDTAGNDGAVQSQAYVYDTAASLASVAAQSTASLTPVLTGNATLAAGETMTVSVGGATYAVVPVAGAWTLDLAVAVPASGALGLARGNTYDVTASVSDLAGNTASDNTSGELVVVPYAPTTTAGAITLSADTGISSSDFLTNTASQTVSGSLSAALTAGESVQVSFDNGGHWQTASVAADLTRWSAAGTLAGSSTLLVKVHNAGGDGPVQAQAYVLDTTAPATPGAPLLVAASDSGSSSADRLTDVATPVITGTAEANVTVTLYDGSTVLGSATADGSGAWSITSSTLAEGAHALTAKATDVAGNVSPASTALSLTIDTGAPAAPSALALSAASDRGSSSADRLTNVATPVITGTAEAGATVTLYDGSTVLGSATADGAGGWAITSTVLADGSHALTARATDVAGNRSAASAALSVTVDTRAPSVTDAQIAIAGASGSGGVFQIGDTVAATWSAAADGNSDIAGASVDFSAFGGGSAVAATYSAGVWSASYTIAANAVVGSNRNVSVTATDLAGNVTTGADSSNATLQARATSASELPPVVNLIVAPTVVATPPSTTPPAATVEPLAAPTYFIAPTSPLADPTQATIDALASALPPSTVEAASTAPAPMPAPIPGGDSSLRVAAEIFAGGGLAVNRGLPDQTIVATGAVVFAIPADTFIATDGNAVVTLLAQQSSGAALPAWISFDGASGRFTVNAPPGFAGEVEITVLARDAQGHLALSAFKIHVGERGQRAGGRAEVDRPGRLGLSEQLRLAARPPGALDRLAQVGRRAA